MADQDSAPSGPRATAQRLAHDLRAIREHREVSIDEVQIETRMPGDILKRLEAGDLIGDPHYNEVYLRNLLKSYAQALAIPPQEVIAAYERAKQGSYDGELRARFIADEDGQTPVAGSASNQPSQGAKAETPKAASTEPASPQKPKPPASRSDAAPAVAALSTPPSKRSASKPKSEPKPAETLPKRRVASTTAASQPLEKSWTIIIAGTVGALIVIAGILWFLFRDDSPEPEQIATAPAVEDTTQADDTDVADTDAEPTQRSSAPAFQRPIELTVVAGDEPLENYRVQVDDDARRPYWVEPGQTESFTAQRSISVWGELEVGATGGGEYDGSRLRLQGLEWSPQDGRVVRIDADDGQAFLDSLARAGANRIGTSG